MPRAASVWLDVLPSMAEFRRQLRRDLEEPVRQSATRAGDVGGESLMSSMSGKMKAGALAAGAVVGALVAQGIQEAIEKQAATGKIKAQLGLSPAEAKKAGAAAGKLYAGTVTETIADGANAVKAIMSAGLAPEKATTKQLASIATKAQDLTTLFEVDLGQAANAAGQAVKTGLAKNANEAFDLMYKGFQIMGPRADDLADTFNEYSTIFRGLGLDMKTVTGILSQGMAAGARDTDTVADALKEFQIRTTDGSKASSDAFKLLKMDAKESTAMFAKGGKGAAQGLQDVLDRLRSMKDPVERNAAAVGLFGTKAEDLGEALFALDPKTAVDGLGKIGGTAKQAGDDLRNNAGVAFEQFKRKALMALGDVAAKHVLPPLMRFGKFLNSDVLPPVKTATMWIGDKLASGLRGTGKAISGTVRWFKEFGIWLTPLAIIVGGLTLALSANAIATGTVTAVFSVYRAAMLIGTAVTTGMATAQAALNAVMALNPFVLLAIGIAALVAGLIIAYNKVGWFRDAVDAAWKGITAGAKWLWAVLKPVLSAIGTALRIAATILVTLWMVAFKVWWTAVKYYFSAVAAIAMWLWKVVLSPVIGWIVAGFKFWWTAVKLYFSLVMTGVRAVGAVFKWLYTNAVKPVVNWIVAGAKLLWSAVKIVFGYFMAGLRTIGGVFKWLWQKAVSPALSGIKSVISTVYTTGIKPVFDKLKSATRTVADAFDTARGGIKRAWEKVSGIAKKPVKFIIDTVYNGGIVKVWNQVAKKFGAPTLDPITGFAKGGIKAGSGFVLPGQSSYKAGDDQLVPMRKGEGVAVSEAMRDPYERSRLLAVNKAAMQGRSLRPFQGEGFAKGGIFDWIGGAASKGVDLAKDGIGWLKDGVEASAKAGLNAVVRPLISKISGSASLYRDMITNIPEKILKQIVSFSGTADKKMEAAGIGGKGFKGALAWVRTQAGKAYQWGGNGNPSWDCSGLTSAAESVLRGQKPHRRWATGAFSGATAPPGWVLNKRSPYMIGITNSGVGHTAGTINGVNIESRGGDGVVVGARARSYRDSLFTHRYGFSAKGYADGGKPRPGEVAWVGEQGPELVRFGAGSAEVYNHADSLRMWEGMGARGFAKGTAAAKAKARKDIPGDLTNFTKSLTGSASDIAKASKELTKDLKAAGVGGKALYNSTVKASAKLQSMAKYRDGLGQRIADARTAASDQKKNANDYFGLSEVGEVTTFSDLVGALKARQAKAAVFEQQIAGLSKKGLAQSQISELVAQGVDGPLIGLVAGASKAQIKQLNNLAASGQKLSTSYGRTMADSMFDAGDAAAKGFLSGLLADEKNIQAAMAKLGAGAVKAIRSKKGIDAHSPSRKGAKAGKDLGAGLVAGMTAAGPSIASAAEQMGASAVPSSLVPVTSGVGAASASGGLGDGPVYLVVEDGTVLRAYVSDRVDDALDDVRRSKRSGKKG